MDKDDYGGQHTTSDDFNLFLVCCIFLKKKANRTMGLLDNVCKFAGLCCIGMVLPRVDIFHFESYIHNMVFPST